jgi:hypothetical protein
MIQEYWQDARGGSFLFYLVPKKTEVMFVRYAQEMMDDGVFWFDGRKADCLKE